MSHIKTVTVNIFLDKALKTPAHPKTAQVKIYSQKNKSENKACMVNPMAVFGGKKQSNKNNLNLVVQTSCGGVNTYRYGLVVEGKTVYFEVKENLRFIKK